jgi:urea transport system substrate-binding protein
LPKPIAERLQKEQKLIADHFDEVSVLFADLVGFTEFSAHKTPTQLVEILNGIFCEFDRLSESRGLEKIKTIGDAYMVVGGLPTPRGDHAQAIALLALEMQSALTQFNLKIGESFQLRIGIHSGSVVAGIIGISKFSYDLWGDTVNVASRMESNGLPGKIQVTGATYERLKEQFIFEERGKIAVKGKGEMLTYWLIKKL